MQGKPVSGGNMKKKRKKKRKRESISLVVRACHPSSRELNLQDQEFQAHNKFNMSPSPTNEGRKKEESEGDL